MPCKMQIVSVQVPPRLLLGQMLRVRLQSGAALDTFVPIDVLAGETFFEVVPSSMVSVQVPPGVVSGQTLQVQHSSGLFYVVVPPGVSEVQSFQTQTELKGVFPSA